MAYMETKQYLNQIGRLDRMIKNKMSELAQYKELAYGLSAVANEEKVKSSTSSFDKIGIKIAKIVEMEEKINNLIDEYVDLKEEALKTINMISNIRYRKILYKKYFKYKSIYVIAKELGMTDRGCKKAHKRALEEFAKNTISCGSIDSSLQDMV
jgi:hypothetical protein